MKIVLASWAIYPGRNNNQLCMDPKGDTSYINTEYSRGNLYLVPENILELETSIKEIIQNTILNKLKLEFS